MSGRYARPAFAYLITRMAPLTHLKRIFTVERYPAELAG